MRKVFLETKYFFTKHNDLLLIQPQYIDTKSLSLSLPLSLYIYIYL